MFRFETPEYLYLLLLLPVLAVMHYLWAFRKRRNLRKYGDPVLRKKSISSDMLFCVFETVEEHRNSRYNKYNRSYEICPFWSFFLVFLHNGLNRPIIFAFLLQIFMF